MLFSKKNSDYSDSELVYKYQKTQNAKYIGYLFDRYGALTYGVCMKYFKNEADSQDATIKIFEKLLEDLKRMEVKHFKSWLYRVAQNHCLMELRKKKPISTSIEDLEYALSEDVAPNKLHEREIRLSALDKALHELKPDQKKCIMLFYIDELSYKEVADKTGYTLNEVKSFIQNGKRNLKILIERLQMDQPTKIEIIS
ncbi:MAG: sigma-70 family RNA polymerase sigma factor [Flavobacteriales bacterium]|nr:sigma-70 family RNA polymerase sigma factor [Flavobacteriales bacterium]